MGLASLLNAKKDIEVIGEANSGAAALKKAPKLKPDVIVMDLIMPEMDGAETTDGKLGVTNRTEAVAITLRKHLLKI